MRVSSTEFQQHVGKYMSKLEKSIDDEILIIKRGKPIFKLVLINKTTKTNTEMLSELLNAVPTVSENVVYDDDETKLQKVAEYEDLT